MNNGSHAYIPNLDPNDRPRVDNIGEIVRVETNRRTIIYMSFEHQGTIRLEGKQADSLVNTLGLLGVKGGWS